MAGGHAQTVRAVRSASMADRVHDYVGLISSTGTGDLTLATGWPRNIASRAVTALTQVPENNWTTRSSSMASGVSQYGVGLWSPLNRTALADAPEPSKREVGTSIGSCRTISTLALSLSSRAAASKFLLDLLAYPRPILGFSLTLQG